MLYYFLVLICQAQNMVLKTVKKFLNWWYNVEIKEIDDRLASQIKRCRDEIFEYERRQFLAQQPHGLFCWIRYQRARWPKSTGNRTTLLIATICILVQLFWVKLFNPSIELRLLVPFSLIFFVFCACLVDHTTFNVKDLNERGRLEYIRKNPTKAEQIEVAVKRIRRRSREFLKKYALNPLLFIAGLFFDKEFFIGMSQYTLPKSIEIFWNLMYENLNFILIIVCLLFLFWAERFWTPMARVKDLLFMLRQEEH
jgi:hypothetical protein